MIDKDIYIRKLTEEMISSFGKRLLYVGLQGSYLRDEAGEKSDIDIMVVLDELDVSALAEYRRIIGRIGNVRKNNRQG